MMRKEIENFIDTYKHTLIFCAIFGIAAHGPVFFYKYTWHDDSSALFGILNYGMGRWMTTLTGHLTARFTSGWIYSVPLLNGLISILLIAVSCCLTLDILKIRNKYFRTGTAMIFAAFPVVTATFGYMFLAPYYFLALFFSTLGVWCVIRAGKRSWLAGCVCFCFVPAFYQAYIGCFLSLLLLWFINQTFDEETDWKEFLAGAMRLLSACATGMAMYFAGMKLSLVLSGCELTSYEGIADMGSTRITEYIQGIKRAYLFFLFPEKMRHDYQFNSAYMFPAGIQKVYHVMFVLFICLTCILLYQSYKKGGAVKLIRMCLLTGLLPAGFHFIFIMCPGEERTRIHSLMIYAEVFFFCYIVWCAEKAAQCGLRSGIWRTASAAVALSTALAGCMYLGFDHVVYLRMQLQYQQYTGVMTTLVAGIRTASGYTDTMPVAFIITGEQNNTLPRYQEFACTSHMIPYSDGYMYPPGSKSGLLNFLKNTCGFAPVVYDETEYDGNETVEQMPVWPDAGSIRRIGGVIVVKL